MAFPDSSVVGNSRFAGVGKGVWYVLLFCCLLLSGCARAKVDPEPLVPVEWSSVEDGLTVRWVEDINDYKDLNLGKGFWSRIGSFLFGDKTEKIIQPYGVYANGQQYLMIADSGSHGVHLMDLESGRYTLISESGELYLEQPIGVVSDGGGRAYITDSSKGAVYVYDIKKKKLSQFNVQKLLRPTGIAFNPNNWLLYVSDTKMHQIVAFGLDGQERFRFSGRGKESGEMNFPTDLWVDRDGNVIVTDALNARVQTFTAEGLPLGSIGLRGHAVGFLDKPKGVAVDSDGHIYVCDSMKDAVQVFDPQGRYLFKFGEQGQGPGQLWMPAGIYIDKNDKIYVADVYNHRVQVYQYLKSAPGDL